MGMAIQVSYDSEQGTLYWYFVELEEGDSQEEIECPVALLVDAQQRVVGCELDFSDFDHLHQLVGLATLHSECTWDAEQGRLRVQCAPFTAVVPLAEPAIIDLNAQGNMLGCDVADVDHTSIPERYLPLAPFMVALDDTTSDTAPALPPSDAGILLPDVTHAGIVAILGRPNVGKSTLLNAVVGQKVAITSPKPQTTRSAIRGILTRDHVQIVFVDTPGIHRPRNRLGTYMVQQARQSVPDADIICMVVDIAHMPNELDTQIASMIRRSRSPKILVLNKIDRPNPHASACLEAFRTLAPWDMEIAISALHGDGVAAFIDEISRRLPAGPAFYAAEQVTDQQERSLCAELVRERIMYLIGDEIPYGIAVEVEEWEQRPRTLYMRMTISVEKESQKAILIGKGGSMLRRIGSEARPAIEAQLGQKVYLELWVKPRSNWRDDPNALRWLGYKK